MKEMQRASKIVGILLMLLLAVGPASAEVACVLGDAQMGSACPMGMATADADCPMTHALSAGDCSQDCCNLNTAITQVVNAVLVKQKLTLSAPQIAWIAPTTVEAKSRFELLPSVAASSPPRYILLRVFRI
jgi:hypothetical protein